MEWIIIYVAVYLLIGCGVAELTYRGSDKRDPSGYIITAILYGILLPLALVKMGYELLQSLRGSGD